MEQRIYVLDLEGYDARGGNARLFASLGGAKAAAGDHVEWIEDIDNEGNTYWVQDVGKSLCDMWVICAESVQP